MQSDIEMAVRWSKRFETLLEDGFGATGRGLHEKINSVRKRLPVATLRKLRFVATIRNKIVHETACSEIEDRGRFERTCSDIVSELTAACHLQTGKHTRFDKDSRTDRHGTVPMIGCTAKSSSWFTSLSPWLSIVGGIVGFAVPATNGERFVPALISATVGVLVGLFWQAVLTAVLLACVIVAVCWLLIFAYNSVH